MSELSYCPTGKDPMGLPADYEVAVGVERGWYTEEKLLRKKFPPADDEFTEDLRRILKLKTQGVTA